MSTFWNILAISGLGVIIAVSLVVAAAAVLAYIAHIVFLTAELLKPVFPRGARSHFPNLTHHAERAEAP